jgi:hypothetical protein
MMHMHINLWVPKLSFYLNNSTEEWFGSAIEKNQKIQSVCTHIWHPYKNSAHSASEENVVKNGKASP